jgi:hypothetical protein
MAAHHSKARNQYFTPSGAISECGEDLAKWQGKGNEPGSNVTTTPSDAAIIAIAKAKLSIQ